MLLSVVDDGQELLVVPKQQDGWQTDLPTALLNSADQNALKNILFRCREYLRAHLATLVDHKEERQPLQFLGDSSACRSVKVLVPSSLPSSEMLKQKQKDL